MNVMLINREWISLSPEHRNVIRANHRTARWVGVPPLAARFLSVVLADALSAAETQPTTQQETQP